MPPTVFLGQQQVQDLIDGSQGYSPGVAFGSDAFEIIHAFTMLPHYRPSGLPCPCVFLVGSEPSDPIPLEAQVRQKLADWGNSVPLRSPVLAVLLSCDPTKVHHRCILFREGSISHGLIRSVPAHDSLYSRSKGLLETDVLSERTVALVGVGSGGSAIAVDLAKSGVGRFLLFDFDCLELSNVSRHVCGISDLGRRKTAAVQDAIWQKNPFARVETIDIDINVELATFREKVASADLIVGATDNNRSRFNINAVAVGLGKTALFGRAITRAAGGDVLRVRPGEGPCLACVFSQNLMSEPDEQSQFRQAREETPAYVSNADVEATVQPGLAIDIAPISNMITRLALLELSRDTRSEIQSLVQDLSADYYIWANRRERIYANWTALGCSFTSPSILRWYGARVDRDAACLVCSHVALHGGKSG